MRSAIRSTQPECRVKLNSWPTMGGLWCTGLTLPVGQSELEFSVARRAKKTGSEAHRHCLPRGKATGLVLGSGITDGVTSRILEYCSCRAGVGSASRWVHLLSPVGGSVALNRRPWGTCFLWWDWCEVTVLGSCVCGLHVGVCGMHCH